MSNIKRSFLFIFALIIAGFSTEWINVHPNGSSIYDKPIITSAKSGDLISIDISSMGIIKDQVELNNTTYTDLSLPGFRNYAGEEGAPAVPSRVFTFEIPENATVSVASVQKKTTQIDGVYIPPIQPPFADGPVVYEDPAFTQNSEIYESNRYFPEDNVIDYSIVKMRDYNLLYVTVAPVQFNPVDSTALFTYELHVDIEINAVAQVSFRSLSPSSEGNGLSRSRAFERMSATEELVSPSFMKSASPQISQLYAPEKYMVIINDALSEEPLFQEFVEWKSRKGYDVRVVLTSEINPNGAPTHDESLGFMRSLSDAEYPSYLLIVGSEDQATGVKPSIHDAYDTRYIHENASDYQLACRESGDFIPDLFYGRLPAESKTDLKNILTKILKMDRDPVGMTHYNRTLIAGELQDDGVDGQIDRLFTETALAVKTFFDSKSENSVITSMTAKEGVNVLPSFKWSKTSILWNRGKEIGSNVSDLILPPITAQSTVLSTMTSGKGAALIQHRDHGEVSGWSLPDIKMNDIANADIEQFPFIFSINCLTGGYNSHAESFVEACLFDVDNDDFISPRGAYGVFAATDISYSWWNDWLTHGMYMGYDKTYRTTVNNYADNELPAPGTAQYNSAEFGLAEGSATKLGAMLHFGKMYMLANMGIVKNSLIEFRIFHLFGDPEMDLVFDEPQILDITLPQSINPSLGESFTIATGKENLQVAFYHKESDYKAVAYTNSAGEITALLPNSITSGEILVTVSGYGVAAYESSIIVSTTPTFPAWESSVEYNSPTDTVSHKGHFYSPNYRTKGAEPDLNSNGLGLNIWKDHGALLVGGNENVSISASAGIGGTITPVGDTSVSYGSLVDYNFAALEGYDIKDVVVNGVSIGVVQSHSLIASENSTIAVTFEVESEQLYKLSVVDGKGSGEYKYGEVVTIWHERAGKPDSTFRHWDDEYLIDDINQNPTTIIMPRHDYEISAQFAGLRKVTASSGANGSISPSGDSLITTYESILYKITPDEGYELSLLFNNDYALTRFSGSEYLLESLFGDVTLHATFQKIGALQKLTATAGSGGTITPLGDTLVKAGTSISYKIIPDEGFDIKDVYIDGILVEAKVYQSLQAGKHSTIDVSFKQIPTTEVTFDRTSLEQSYDLSRSVITGAGQYPVGSEQVISIDAELADNYYFDHWELVSGQGDIQTPTSPTTTVTVGENMVIKPVVKKLFSIVVESGANGKVSDEGKNMLVEGAFVTYTVLPDPGYEVDKVTLDGNDIGSKLEIEFRMVNTNHTLMVTFKKSAAVLYPEWNSSQAYARDEIVSYEGQNWQAKWWNRGNKPDVSGPWKLFYPAWDASQAYVRDEIVSYNGKNWQAQWNNLGKEPGVKPAWLKLN